MLKLGPILKFIGKENDEWRISVFTVFDATDAPPILLSSSAKLSAAMQVGSLSDGKLTAWRWDMTIPQPV